MLFTSTMHLSMLAPRGEAEQMWGIYDLPVKKLKWKIYSMLRFLKYSTRIIFWYWQSERTILTKQQIETKTRLFLFISLHIRELNNKKL